MKVGKELARGCVKARASMLATRTARLPTTESGARVFGGGL